jgi:hypothetical protein
MKPAISHDGLYGSVVQAMFMGLKMLQTRSTIMEFLCALKCQWHGLTSIVDRHRVYPQLTTQSSTVKDPDQPDEAEQDSFYSQFLSNLREDKKPKKLKIVKSHVKLEDLPVASPPTKKVTWLCTLWLPPLESSDTVLLPRA